MRLAAAITRPQSHRKFVGNTQKNVAKHTPATCDNFWHHNKAIRVYAKAYKSSLEVKRPKY